MRPAFFSCLLALAVGFPAPIVRADEAGGHPIATTMSYCDVTFPKPDEARWTHRIVDGNLVFSAVGVRAPQRFDFTVYATRRHGGDRRACASTFEARVGGLLLYRPGTTIDADAGTKDLPMAGFDAGCRRRFSLRSGPTASELDLIAWFGGGRFHMFSFEYTPGLPQEEQLLADVNATLGKLTFRRSMTLYVKSPVGSYVLDPEYFRQSREAALRRKLAADTTPAALELAVLQAMRGPLAGGVRIDLSDDGSYRSIENVLPLPATGEAAKLVHTGTWKLVGDDLHVTVAGINGTRLPTPIVQVLPYKGGAFILDPQVGLRMVKDSGAVEPDPIVDAGPGPAPVPAPEPVPAPVPVPVPTPPPAPDAAPAPVGPVYDTSKLEALGFKIIRTAREPGTNDQFWILEATKDQLDYLSYGANFYDEDGVLLQSGFGRVEPVTVLKGGRMRLTISLPIPSVFERAKKAVLFTKA